MKRIIIGIGILVVFGILISRLNLPLTEPTVVGTFVSNETVPFLSDVPHKADTLTLNSDGTFISGFYGSGTYELHYGLLTSEIGWNYNYEMGNAEHRAIFTHKIFKEPEIVLNRDLDHLYKKVN